LKVISKGCFGAFTISYADIRGVSSILKGVSLQYKNCDTSVDRDPLLPISSAGPIVQYLADMPGRIKPPQPEAG
jgi:hypothetical protein